MLQHLAEHLADLLLHVVDGTDRREFPGKPLETGDFVLAVVVNHAVLLCY